jgi:hypothetical protein
MISNQFKNAFLVFATGFAIVAAGCGSGNSDGSAGENDTTETDNMKAVQAQNVFYSIPSPIEVASLIKKAGAKYDKSYLNPIESVSKYTSSISKALNLGVYGTDLSFTSIFEQTQESMLYLKCANTLASGLGISGAFGAATVARVEANMDNRDSLLEIISDAFWTSDSYLKENDRPNTSALIIAGGWIEGLYIATKVAETTTSTEIDTRIGEQKLSLQNLIALIESYGKDETTDFVLNDLKSLKQLYDNVQFNKSKVEVSTDNKSQVTTIGGGSSVSMSKEQLKEISAKIQSVRNNIIQ